MLHFRPSQLQREEEKYKDAHWKVLANTKNMYRYETQPISTDTLVSIS